METIIFKGEMMDLNSYLAKVNSNRFIGNKIKQEQTDFIMWECKRQGVPPVKIYPVIIKFRWYSKDRRKDIDNVGFSKKFILDGLVKAGVLENDGRKQIVGFMDLFFIDKENPRVEVAIG